MIKGQLKIMNICCRHNPYFSKPGPRTITGIEILTKIISPTEFKHITIPENSYSKLITNDLTNK